MPAVFCFVEMVAYGMAISFRICRIEAYGEAICYRLEARDGGQWPKAIVFGLEDRGNPAKPGSDRLIDWVRGICRWCDWVMNGDCG